MILTEGSAVSSFSAGYDFPWLFRISWDPRFSDSEAASLSHQGHTYMYDT